MGQSAKVTSIDMLPLLSAAIQKFRGESANALDDLETELRRLLEWIHHDRRDYWTQELRRAQDALSQAKLQLQQAMTVRQVAGHSPSCTDERRTLERARRRVEVAMRKIEAVRRWTMTLERAADDFRRTQRQFATWLDLDLPRAVAALNQMSEALVAYITMKSSDELKAADAETTAETPENTGDQAATSAESAPPAESSAKEAAS